jgi:hypothetical protein
MATTIQPPSLPWHKNIENNEIIHVLCSNLPCPHLQVRPHDKCLNSQSHPRAQYSPHAPLLTSLLSSNTPAFTPAPSPSSLLPSVSLSFDPIQMKHDVNGFENNYIVLNQVHFSVLFDASQSNILKIHLQRQENLS